MLKNYIREKINKKNPPASRLTLQRNQVYIFLSKFGFLYIGLCFILLILAVNFENSLVYILLFWLISLFVTTMIYTWMNLAGLHIRASGVNPIFVDEQAEFKVTIESLTKRNYRAIWLMTEESNAVLDCSAKSSASTSLFVTGLARGHVILPRFKVMTTFPLGIFTAWSYVDLNQSTLCYPKPKEQPLAKYQHIEESEPSEYEHANSSKTSGVDNFEGQKSYEVGDSISKINWHAYARGHGLHVKVFSKQSMQEIWLSEHDFTGTLEAKLSALCYWVLALEKDQVPFGFKLGMLSLPPDNGKDHVDKCLSALALYRN